MRARLRWLCPLLLACSSRTSPPPTAATCHRNADCDAARFCRFTPGLCGRGGESGRCVAKPRACASSHAPVCACDGTVRDDACAAFSAGLDLDVEGSCKDSVPDHIACGANYCEARRSYCEIYLSDVRALPSEHTCKALPMSCRPRDRTVLDCSCFPADTPCLSFCGPLPTLGVSGFHLTCQGVRPRSPNAR